MGCDHHHMVLLPFLAHGHLIPFLALAKQIKRTAPYAVTVTIATTRLNLQYLQRTTNSSANDILFAELIPLDDDDSTNYKNNNTIDENTENLNPSEIDDLCHHSLRLESPFRKLMADITAKEGRPPLCIVSDVFFGWAVHVANAFRTLNVTFTTGGAYGTIAYISLWLHLPHRQVNSNDDDFALPGFPKRCRFRRDQLLSLLRYADGTDARSRFMQPQISLSLKSHAWLCNTVEEIEPLGLQILRNYVKLPVWSIPASCADSYNNNNINSESGQRCGKELGISAEKCLAWLDEQRPASVVYVSFGSQNTIGASQMMELAKGLEMSGRPFVWVVRPPMGFDQKSEFRSEIWLPEGFEERITRRTKRGLIVRGWAPQVEILCHRSTAVFVSHCGWNSVMESLSQGVPIIGWPLAAEQAYNSKMLVEEMGVSVELTRGVESRVDCHQVKKVIDYLVMEDGDDVNIGAAGISLRKKATEIKEHIKRASLRDELGGFKGSSVKALDDFMASVLADYRH